MATGQSDNKLPRCPHRNTRDDRGNANPPVFIDDTAGEKNPKTTQIPANTARAKELPYSRTELTEIKRGRRNVI